ncbi:DUF4124 domain-containing protein [Pseudoalteromonas sp. McH1-7]|nr:DUF4124 domain-containing protein [Pseudoalteromonas sp. McH1-7]RXF01163.1 DUF4124 domain-containing protein [Pseudoalteromonas sp. PS5]USD30097.1 DUF4124 domain-containing protein [Pseudoalteromonas sp. SCSIO 43201]
MSYVVWRVVVRQWGIFFSVSMMLTIISIDATAESNPKIYRWKDKNGHWVYSDIPKPGSKEVKLHSNILTMPSIDTKVLASQSDTTPTITYQAKITSPENEQTIRDNSGSVYVTGSVEPRFTQGLSVQLYLNGEATGPKQSNAQFSLRNIHRGEHALVLKVFNQKGQVVAQSNEHKFYLHRNTVNN